METINSNSMGKVIQVMGPVIDVEFKGGRAPSDLHGAQAYQPAA